jgi:3-oxoacyl-[acyl-carrier-protein] synthase-3
VADSFIASGRYENVLVTVGELISPYIDWNPKSREDLKLSSMGYTLGDAGGAAILTRVSDGDECGLRARWFLSDGEHWRVAIIPPMTPNGERYKFKSDGAAIERVACEHIPSGVEMVLDMLEWTVKDIDLIVPHQVASPVTENILYKQLGISSEKVVWTFPRYGNNGAASMPVAMCEALRQEMVHAGGKVLFIGGSGGFGAGVLALIV